jgi:acyl-CoA dehydrogenase
MDFGLSKEQRDIQKAAREFAEAEFDKDYMLDLELNHKFPHELLKKACDLGFLGIDFPEEYGGAGYGLIEKALVCEEFGRVGGGVGTRPG